MKKVGIITIVRVNNIGAELQAFATQYAIRKLGVETEIIDYLFYKHPLHVRESISKPFYPYPFKDRIKESINKWKTAMMEKFHHQLQQERNERIERFHREHTRFSQKQYRRMSDLYEETPHYDVYCVGSDQVWNPRCYTSLYPYLLTFAPKNSRKISYASSFGVSTLPTHVKDIYRNCLEQFHCISTRENQGCTLIKDMGLQSQLVCDPTLLLTSEEWRSIGKTVDHLPDKFILLYELRTLAFTHKVVKKIKQETGLPVIRISTDYKTHMEDYICKNAIGPSEFIYLFDKAQFVVTNSFHGTAFSINFKKDFYTILGKHATNNSRQINLLQTCGLSDRLLSEDSVLPDVLSPSIDYKAPSLKLEQFRQESLNYLRHAIHI